VGVGEGVGKEVCVGVEVVVGSTVGVSLKRGEGEGETAIDGEGEMADGEIVGAGSTTSFGRLRPRIRRPVPVKIPKIIIIPKTTKIGLWYFVIAAIIH